MLRNLNFVLKKLAIDQKDLKRSLDISRRPRTAQDKVKCPKRAEESSARPRTALEILKLSQTAQDRSEGPRTAKESSEEPRTV